MAAVELATVPYPLAVFPAYIAQHTTTLIMKESIFSLMDAFTVQTLDGQDVLKINTDVFPLSSRKRVYDLHDNHLFTLRNGTFSLAKSFYAESPEGNRIFQVEGKVHFGSPKSIGHFINPLNNEREDLEMQGSFLHAKTVLVFVRR